MAVFLPIVAAIAAPTFFTIAAAALGVAGLISGNKTLGMLGGLIGMAGGFAGGFAGAAGGAEAAAGVAGAADSTAALEAGLSAYSGPNYAQAIQSGADATQLSENVASLAQDSVGNAALLDQGSAISDVGKSTFSDPGSLRGDLPGSPLPENPAEASLRAPSSNIARDTLSGQSGPLSGQTELPGQGGLLKNAEAPKGSFLDSDVSSLLSNETGLDTAFSGYKADVTAAEGLPGVGKIGQSEFSATNAAVDKGTMSKIWDLFSSQGDVTKSAIVKMLGEGIAGGFKRNPNAELVDLYKDRFDAEQAELARKRANQNNIPEIRMNVRPNENATLYPNGQYRPVGILQSRRA